MQALRATHGATRTVGRDCCRPSYGRPTGPKLTCVIRIRLAQRLGRKNRVFDLGGVLVATLCTGLRQRPWRENRVFNSGGLLVATLTVPKKTAPYERHQARNQKKGRNSWSWTGQHLPALKDVTCMRNASLPPLYTLYFCTRVATEGRRHLTTYLMAMWAPYSSACYM